MQTKALLIIITTHHYISIITGLQTPQAQHMKDI